MKKLLALTFLLSSFSVFATNYNGADANSRDFLNAIQEKKAHKKEASAMKGRNIASEEKADAESSGDGAAADEDDGED